MKEKFYSNKVGLMSYEEWLSALKRENKTDKTDHLVEKFSKDGYRRAVLSTQSPNFEMLFSRAPLSSVISSWNDHSVNDIQNLSQLGVG